MPQKKVEERTKRKSVSAEVYGVYNPKGDFKPEIYPKDDLENEILKKLLSDIFMFRHLEEKEFKIVIDAMHRKDYEAGDVVIK